VHIWRARLSENSPAHLTTQESERADRFRLAADRSRFAITRAILRNILGQYLDLPPQSLQFQYTGFGKPFLDPSQNPLSIRFNVSHSGDLALLAFAIEHEVGIDIEHLLIERSMAQLAQAELSPSEYHEFLALPEPARKAAFLQAWTRKEAIGKALGVGLSVSAGDFGDASVSNLDAADDYAAAVVVRSPRIKLRLWNWTNASGTASLPA
jgi:4'-phosphopantetheinyl transferase